MKWATGKWRRVTLHNGCSANRNPLHSSRPRICSPLPSSRAHSLALTQASTGLPVVCRERTQPALPGPHEGECGLRVTGRPRPPLQPPHLTVREAEAERGRQFPASSILPIPKKDKRPGKGDLSLQITTTGRHQNKRYFNAELEMQLTLW